MSIIFPELPLDTRTRAHRRSSSAAAVSLRPPRYSYIDGAQTASTTPSPRPAYDTPPLEHTSSSDTASLNNNRRPPRYSTLFDRDRARRDRERRTRTGASGAHRGHGSSGPQLHEYHLRSGHGAKAAPYATLRLYSRASASSSGSASLYAGGASSTASSLRIPKFCGADLVQGSLDLSLETPQNINSISLSLRGRIITSSYDGGSYTFLEHPIASWTRANGDPRTMLLAPIADANDSGCSARPKKFEGKLSGSYSWPFSFPFPQEVKTAAQNGGEGRASPTPQSFSEKHIRGSIQYELVLRMSHGILRSDSKLHAPIIYLPDITPAPSSALRQIAYGENMGMPGPHVDSMGWHVLPPTTVRGNIFRERNVKLQCTLSLANPLSYTRGTVIPCHISIESSDTQALDVLATPKALALRLMRRVQYYDETAVPSQSRPRTGGNIAGDKSGGIIEISTEIESAVWWVNEAASGAHGSKRRQLEGEIHLDKELQPSCDFSLFKVSYAVELLPFATPVFQLLVKGSGGSSSPALKKCPEETLIFHPVTISTLHGEGPVAVAYTQPPPRSSKKIQARAYSPGSSAIAGVGVYI